jgi:DNA (cytosine-5)-methyltransferase 1
MASTRKSTQTLKIGTDCSGIEAPIQALINLRVPFRHVWACENDKWTQMSIRANYSPEKLYGDITTRNHSKLPKKIDIYICGFPCQPFSMAGLRKGMKDERSSIVMECIETIRQTRPKAFVLENVRHFQTIQNGRPYKNLMRELAGIGLYDVTTELLNTKDYGLPQYRQRMYIIGIRQDVAKQPFKTPPHVKMVALKSIIDASASHEKSPLRAWVMRKLKAEHEDYEKILNGNYSITTNYVHVHKNIMGTLTTHNRPWLTKYKRYITPRECLRLQGFPDTFKIVVADTHIVRQTGNAMSVNVLEAIFEEIFRVAKI